MLKTKNTSMRESRKRLRTKSCLFLVVFLILVFLIIPREAYGLELENVNVDRYDLGILENEVFAVYIQPVPEYVSVNCVPLDRGNPFDLTVSTNSSFLFGKVTAIWMQPGSQGKYNMTISFQSGQVWTYRIGIHARNINFYRDFYGENVKIDGYFVQLEDCSRIPGNWTINILVNSHSGSSPPPFVIELPTPANSILLATVAGFIAYSNAFLVLDTYFKNKKEIISSKRWILCGVVIVISILLIYQLYTFTTFTLSGGVER